MVLIDRLTAYYYSVQDKTFIQLLMNRMPDLCDCVPRNREWSMDTAWVVA